MATCATQETIVEKVSIGNLFLPVPDTDFRSFLEEVEELRKFATEIIDAIEADLDIHAKEKKKLRLADWQWKSAPHQIRGAILVRTGPAYG